MKKFLLHYSMKMIGWSDDADIEHKMPYMEANKKRP